MKRELKAFFKKYNGSSFKAKEIAKRLQIEEEHKYHSLKAALNKLVEEEFIIKTGKRFGISLKNNNGALTGILQIKENGYGFVIINKKDSADVFISQKNLGTAFNGDTVEVSLFAKQKGKNLEGQIFRVVNRKRKEIIGTLKKYKSFFIVVPDDKGVTRDIYINENYLNGAVHDDKVIVTDVVWEDRDANPEGKISEVLGKVGKHKTDMTAIVKEFMLPSAFPKSVITEAEEIQLINNSEEINKRIDFRNKTVFTIDPFDAKDFDDALSIEKLPNGNFYIGVHIADVSHYVPKGSSLDKEALRRGNSVYLVGEVIPMLPERLSNNICSLVPYEDRLTYSVLFEITSRGKVENYKIAKTIINSKRRFTYEEVQEIIEKEEGDLLEDILLLNSIARVLRKKRFREGSIDFSTSEIKFELNEIGEPIKIIKKEMKESNQLVEEFMLLANQIVAKHINEKKSNLIPFVYRVHDLPDKQKIIDFANFVKSLGFNFSIEDGLKSKGFQKLMEQVKGHHDEFLINDLAIRSMAKAVYSAENIGHYGLGFKYYSHFTSPIRRYSDLIIHRILFEKSTNGKIIYSFPLLEEICEHISQTERTAIEAERESVKIKQIEYLRNHVGEEFDAVISGIVHFGMFVRIIDVLAEGLIRLRDLEGDFYVFDEKKYSLIGKRTKRVYRLGDKIRVKLIRADLVRGELDFIAL